MLHGNCYFYMADWWKLRNKSISTGITAIRFGTLHLSNYILVINYFVEASEEFNAKLSNSSGNHSNNTNHFLVKSSLH